MIVSKAVELLYRRWRQFLYLWPGIFNLQTLALWRERLLTYIEWRQYAGLVPNRNAFSLFCFVDGTFTQTTKPGDAALARAAYSGYHRCYGANVMCVVGVQGLFLSIGKTWPGHANDITLWRNSPLYQCFQNRDVLQYLRAVPQQAAWLVVGDSIFPQSSELISPLRNSSYASRRALSRPLAELRVVHEQQFASWRNNFASVSFYPAFKWGLQPLDRLFAISFLLENCRMCISGVSFAGEKYRLPPPRLEEYLSASIDDIDDDDVRLHVQRIYRGLRVV